MGCHLLLRELIQMWSSQMVISIDSVSQMCFFHFSTGSVIVISKSLQVQAPQCSRPQGTQAFLIWEATVELNPYVFMHQ